MKIVRGFALLLCMFVPLMSGAVAYLRLESGILDRRLKAAPADAAARLKLLRQQFKEAGCDPKTSREQQVEGESSPNLICTLPGSAKGTIIVAAPLDYEFSKDNAPTGWATVAMLPLLAESLNGSSHRCNFVFIAFAGHHQTGAAAYLSQLTEAQRSSIVAMIDLESLGRTEATYSFPGARVKRDVLAGHNVITVTDPHEETPVSKLFMAAAHTLKYDIPSQTLDSLPSTDADQFEKARFPSLIVTSLGYTVVTSFGDVKTRISKTSIDLKAYNKTYNLLCVFGLHLDQAFGREAVRAGERLAADTQIAEHLMTTINAMRSGAQLPPLEADARVTDDAQHQAAAFATNRKASEEAPIEQRMANLGVFSSAASEVWFMFPEQASKNDALIRESIGEDAQKTLLDPRFTIAGVAAIHRGASYFAVANVVAPIRESTPAEAENALITAIQLARKRAGVVEFKNAVATESLRQVACSMAKQDSLQVAIDAVKTPKVFAFTSGNPEGSSWVNEIASYGVEAVPIPHAKLNDLSVGICRAASASVPNGTFWVVVALNREQ